MIPLKDFGKDFGTIGFNNIAMTLELMTKQMNAEANELEEASSSDAATLADFADKLRGATAYPFNPSWKVSNKKRYEKVLESVIKLAEEMDDLATKAGNSLEKRYADAIAKKGKTIWEHSHDAGFLPEQTIVISLKALGDILDIDFFGLKGTENHGERK